MGQISLLHIGDIHYDSQTTHRYSSEPRTRSEYIWSELSGDEKKNLAPYLIRLIKKQLFKHIEEERFDSIILSGDLCSGGRINDYMACLNYLEIQFQNFCKMVKREDLEIAVGNHDLNADYEYDSKKIERRFADFCDVLKSKRMRKYPIFDVNEKLIKTSDGNVLLLNVNSCLEFGNLDLHSKSVRTTISNELKNGASKSERNRLLNVPYIGESLISSICEIIKKNPDCLPIIITHHNFLRCRVFDPNMEYDGILNEGTIRQKFIDLNRSILIVHGHIHDDSITTIDLKGGKVVYSSAPLLFPLVSRSGGVSFGYNVLNVIFGNNPEKTPLGCEIEYYQLNNRGTFSMRRESIKFLDSSEAITYLSDLEKSILKKITSINENIYVGLLLTTLKEAKIINSSYELAELIQVLDRLYWLNLIEFRKISTNIKYSIVRGWF